MWQVFLDGLSVFSEKWPLVLGAVGFTCLGCSLVFFLSRSLTKERKIPGRSVGLVVFFFALSVILRLAFVSETFVPPYFDSVEHYRIIKELVTGMETSTALERLPSLTPSYYHLGFHLLASFLTFGLRANPIDVILVLGQVILAAIPIPLFFLLRAETKSDAAAFFGILLAGFGWYMPGFAINWGKYPALAGIFAFELVLSIAYLIFRQNANRNQLLSISSLVLAILISTTFHTRTLVVVLVSFVGWLVVKGLRNLPKIIQYLSVGFLLAGLLILGIVVQQDPLLNLALDPYLGDGIWITLTVVLLSPFAFLKFPQGAYFSVLFTLLILIALFIPIGTWLPGFESQTLLDRPFVEMLLYMPLSILGSLGLAGLLQFLSDKKGFSERMHRYAQGLTMLVFFCVAILLPLRDYNFYPSDCCNFVGYDDTVVLDWLEKNIPPDARILISATQLNVLPSGPSTSSVGTDAGIWIPALTGRTITYTQFGIDFCLSDTLEQICQERVDYVYVGGTDQSFDVAQLLAKRNWYDPVLSLQNAQLFRVTGCFE